MAACHCDINVESGPRAAIHIWGMISGDVEEKRFPINWKHISDMRENALPKYG